jgi:hypothetical protein
MDEGLMREFRPTFLDQIVHRAAALLPSPLSRPLRAAQTELCRSLQLAFSLAATHRRVVLLEPCRKPAAGRIAFRLPEGVRWGCPATVPLPPSLADTGWWGGRPRPIAVLPQQRASANVWFLHHGREALCFRLDLSGAVELLWYRPLLRTWVRSSP